MCKFLPSRALIGPTSAAAVTLSLNVLSLGILDKNLTVSCCPVLAFPPTTLPILAGPAP